MQASLFCHHLGNLIGKSRRVVRQDAFQKQGLIVEKFAVVFEILGIFAGCMERLETAKEVVIGVDFQNAAGFEHGVIGCGKGLFHSDGRTGCISDEADSAGFQAV